VLVSSEVRRHEGRRQETFPPQHDWGGCATVQAAADGGPGARAHLAVHRGGVCRELDDKLQKYHRQPSF